MVLSRSTFAGSGKHTGHWLGDNFARWSNMGDSIIGIVTQSIAFQIATHDQQQFQNCCEIAMVKHEQ